MNVKIKYGNIKNEILNCKSIYDAVDIFEKKHFIKYLKVNNSEDISLRSLINLHNID